MSIINAIKSLTFPRGIFQPSYIPLGIRANGWLPDPASDSDPKFEVMSAKITPVEPKYNCDIDLRQYCSPVEQQANVGSCSANAAIGAVEMRRIRAGFKHVDLSRLFAYFNGRVGDQSTNVDGGSYIKLVLESMTRLGVCKEDIWPYDTTKVNLRPSWNSYRDAYAYKISAFYRITSTGEQRINQIIEALRAHYPVVFGVNVWESFYKCSGTVQMPQAGEKKLGGHAMLIVGVDINNRCFLVRNSWGTDWGDEGYCYMPFSYFDVGDAGSFWSITL